jgi:hypothetical protein
LDETKKKIILWWNAVFAGVFGEKTVAKRGF